MCLARVVTARLFNASSARKTLALQVRGHAQLLNAHSSDLTD